MDILYSAQHRPHPQPDHTQPQFPNGESTAAPTQPHAPSHGGQQRSLHSFWTLPKPAAASPNSFASSPASSTASFSSPAFTLQSASTQCEDCGVGLGGSGDDMMMDVDEYSVGQGDQICGACGKTVCFSCSITNLGEHRRCLACAGPRS